MGKYILHYGMTQKESSYAQVTLAAAGRTDLTLICSAPNFCKFVFKVIKPNHLHTARILSQALLVLNMKAPEMIPLTGKSQLHGARFFGSFARNYSGYDSTRITRCAANWQSSGQALCFMKAFEGATLGALIRYERMALLSKEQLASTWVSFGKVAFLDLAFGIDDRFFRPNLEDGESTFNECFINSGNIMLSIDPEGKLRNLFLIDNVSFNDVTITGDLGGDYISSLEKYSAKFQDILISCREESGVTLFSEAVFKGLERIHTPLSSERDQSITLLKEGIISGMALLAERGRACLETFETKVAEIPESKDNILIRFTLAHFRKSLENILT